MLKYLHVFYKMWDAHFAVPTYNFKNHLTNFDFIFKVNIPKPDKERLITKRDGRGRIVCSSLQVLDRLNIRR